MSTVLVFLLACILILILVIAMYLILKNTVKKINEQSKSYFVDKLQEYDYLIDEKENKLNQIDKELKEKELNNNTNTEESKKGNFEFDYNIINLLNETKYQDKNVFEINKKIESDFNIDYKKIINSFLSNNENDSNYLFCLNLRNKFDPEVIYKLKIMDREDMEKELKGMLDEKEYKIYEIYKSISEKPSLESFIDYLNELVDSNNPNIIVYVGNKEENYDDMSKYIKTKYSKDIYKGIKIIYKNKIYDYSLNERNV